MPKARRVHKSLFELNFPQSAQAKFEELVNDESWSWAGLAMALKKKFTPGELDDFIYCLQNKKVTHA